MRVIPAIDLLDGAVVRLKKGNYNEVTIYNDDPVEEAQKFADAGFSHIHVVDLNGARKGNFVNLAHIKAIKEQTGLSVQTGGGIRSRDHAQLLFDAGLNQLVCSSMAVKSPDAWRELLTHHPEKMILGLDLKDGQMAYDGWEQTSAMALSDFVEPMIKAGLQYVLSTDIARDGMLQGANVALYEQLQQQFPSLNFIASGGVAGVEDLEALVEHKLYGVVVGRAYYEGALSLQQMKQFDD